MINQQWLQMVQVFPEASLNSACLSFFETLLQGSCQATICGCMMENAKIHHVQLQMAKTKQNKSLQNNSSFNKMKTYFSCTRGTWQKTSNIPDWLFNATVVRDPASLSCFSAILVMWLQITVQQSLLSCLHHICRQAILVHTQLSGKLRIIFFYGPS